MNNIIIKKNITINECLKILNEANRKILFVVDDGEILVGSITDGDIRRWILKNNNLDISVEYMMNKSPFTLTINNKQDAEFEMKKRSITAIPIIDHDKKILEIIFKNGNTDYKNMNNSIVIMAGGKGTRLYPYTQVLPKPLIPIKGKTIIERIIDNFKNKGFNDFYLTVNHKKEIIKSYLNSIERDYIINFIEEEHPLGTGGSLSLLKGKLNSTFFLTNCDIIVEANYCEILDYHKVMKNKITIVSALRNYEIPYGVINLNEDESFYNISEKPKYSFFVNTGFYVVEPDVLNSIPYNTKIDFPDIAKMINDNGGKIGVYPISESSWMDMGQIKDMDDMIEKII